VFEHEKKNELNYGTVNRIYFTDNFSNNIYIINITEKNNSTYSTNFRLQDINILKECESIQEAEDYIDMINNSNKFNL
jgi:DNA modification methylase